MNIGLKDVFSDSYTGDAQVFPKLSKKMHEFEICIKAMKRIFLKVNLFEVLWLNLDFNLMYLLNIHLCYLISIYPHILLIEVIEIYRLFRGKISWSHLPPLFSTRIN